MFRVEKSKAALQPAKNKVNVTDQLANVNINNLKQQQNLITDKLGDVISTRPLNPCKNIL